MVIDVVITDSIVGDVFLVIDVSIELGSCGCNAPAFSERFCFNYSYDLILIY